MTAARSWPGRATAEPAPDVVVIGGGVVGCSIAYHLSRAGRSVLLVERDHLASGASGVAAGMLAPQVEADQDDPFFELTLRGRADHLSLASTLMDEVGLDVECRMTGILRVAENEGARAELLRRLRWQTERGLRAEWIEPRDLGEREPLLAGVAGRLLAGALWLPDEGQVRGQRLVQALAMASRQRGARLLEGAPVWSLATDGERVTGVRLPRGVVAAGTTVLAAGVWSGDLTRQAGLDLPITSVKGQIMTLESARFFPRHIIWLGECYLTPKADGQVLLGATQEEGNFDRRPTLAGIGGLTEAALEALPALGQFAISSLWAGLRPAVPDRYPVIGRAPGLENLILATAHYRNGILLGPLTGQWVTDLIETGALPPEIAPLGLERLRADMLSATEAGRTPGRAHGEHGQGSPTTGRDTAHA